MGRKQLNMSQQITARLPAALAEKVKRAADHNGMTFSDVLRWALSRVFVGDVPPAIDKSEAKP